MVINISQVATNARLKTTYTGDNYIEQRYCRYAPINNTLLVASREFVYDISRILRENSTLFPSESWPSRVPVWFRPCEYDDSFFNFQPDNGSQIFTYMKGVDQKLLDGDKKVYVSVAIAGLIKGSTILIQPAILKSVKRI